MDRFLKAVSVKKLECNKQCTVKNSPECIKCNQQYDAKVVMYQKYKARYGACYLQYGKGCKTPTVRLTREGYNYIQGVCSKEYNDIYRKGDACLVKKGLSICVEKRGKYKKTARLRFCMRRFNTCIGSSKRTRLMLIRRERGKLYSKCKREGNKWCITRIIEPEVREL